MIVDGPCCYIDSWDLAHIKRAREILAIKTVEDRRAALDEIARVSGDAARQRMERTVKRLWSTR